MKRSHLFTLLGALCAVVTASAVACSSSDTTPGTNPIPDTGGTGDTGGGGDTATGDTGGGGDTATGDTGSSGETSGDVGGDSSSVCGSDPTLHPVKTGEGVYCPGVGDAGFGAPCAVGQICCDTPSKSTPPSSCIASGTTCPTTTPKAGSTWECDSPLHCTGGKICCGLGTPKLRTGCTYEEVFPALGSKCETACAAGEYTVCEVPADCTGGKVCTAIKSGGKQVGYCK